MPQKPSGSLVPLLENQGQAAQKQSCPGTLYYGKMDCTETDRPLPDTPLGFPGPSLAASPSPPGRSSGRTAKLLALGGEGLANIARFSGMPITCTCEPVKCQLELRTSSVPLGLEASRLD